MLFCCGVGLSLIILAIVPSGNLVAVSLGILPGCVCGLLVFPIPNYHNVLCALCSIYRFYTERRRYVWRGWCFYEQFKDTKSKK